MDIMNLMKERFSARKFDQTKPISQESQQQILEAGLLAPTAHNNQGFHLYVAGQKQSEKIMPKCTSSNYHAGMNILITVNPKEAWTRSVDQWNAGQVDSAIVITQMMYMAESLGLGTCWICAFSPEETKKEFKVKSGEIPISILSIGYKADDCQPSPRHLERKPFQEMITFLD